MDNIKHFNDLVNNRNQHIFNDWKIFSISTTKQYTYSTIFLTSENTKIGYTLFLIKHILYALRKIDKTAIISEYQMATILIKYYEYYPTIQDFHEDFEEEHINILELQEKLSKWVSQQKDNNKNVFDFEHRSVITEAIILDLKYFIKSNNKYNNIVKIDSNYKNKFKRISTKITLGEDENIVFNIDEKPMYLL